MARYTEDMKAVQQYINSIQQYATLSFEEEQDLARRWLEKKERKAAHRLINSHLRLVVKVAIGFRGYGLPLSELIQEGNIGLMHAVTRFDPDKGFRLSTYAMWWIKASIQEYILHSWSLVKIGTTAAQKKLFFNLRKLRNRLREVENEALSEEAIEIIAHELGVKTEEVIGMDQRMMSGDQSLNAMISADVGSEWMDWLVEERPNQEESYSETEIFSMRHASLKEALTQLDERERDILIARRLREEVITLEDLSHRYGISRERVRQLEVRAFNKIRKFMVKKAA
ncbi:MAG: RNA polymerase sigma factor RpoH [Proteobacteria bacterium]|nr:RNA polymerase sigma factor RpoH [Pseudomonadota bacterium]